MFCSCRPTEQIELVTRSCAPMPKGRASACCCTLDGKAYVFGGRDAAGQYCNDLWAYDPIGDTWTALGSAPLLPRVNATMAAVGGQLYVGLGYAADHAYRDTAYLRDWWTYSPATGNWTRCNDYPTANTVAVSSYTVDGYIYALYGFGYGYTKDIFRYDINADTWTQVERVSDRAWPHRQSLSNTRRYERARW